MKKIGEINDREILYIKYDLEAPWFKDLPKRNWLLFAITDRKISQIFDEVARRTIDNNVVYVCSAGNASSFFEERVDEIILIRSVEDGYLPDWCIMTTSEQELEEEFWFTIYSAIGETQEITKIICLDLTISNNENKLIELVEKMKTGWMPG